jgi:hypothetical protein
MTPLMQQGQHDATFLQLGRENGIKVMNKTNGFEHIKDAT